MYEDYEVERASLPDGRVLSIASAGDVSFALAAAGREVVAVDVNPAQVDYVHARMTGEPPRRGQADRYLDLAARILPLLGLTRHRLERFFDLDEPPAQVEAWRRLAGRRFHAALMVAFGPALRVAYRGALASALPTGFASELGRRLARGFGIHPNRSNPFARTLFGLAAAPTPPQLIVVERAEVVAYLRAQPADSFDGFAFSNITDGAPAGFREELLAAARQTARRGATAVLRTLGLPRHREDAARAATDRALVWGGIDVIGVR